MAVEVGPLSRTLAHLLRHEPWRYHVELDAQGWADVDDIVRNLRERRFPELTRADVERAVARDARQRFEVAKGRIRAVYGHSVHVAPGEVAEPPETLYAAVPRVAFRGVGAEGLHPLGRRAFVHLTEEAGEAREVGQRKDREPVLLAVRAADAARSGVVFRHSGDLWLTERIPAQFLEARG